MLENWRLRLAFHLFPQITQFHTCEKGIIGDARLVAILKAFWNGNLEYLKICKVNPHGESFWVFTLTTKIITSAAFQTRDWQKLASTSAAIQYCESLSLKYFTSHQNIRDCINKFCRTISFTMLA